MLAFFVGPRRGYGTAKLAFRPHSVSHVVLGTVSRENVPVPSLRQYLTRLVLPPSGAPLVRMVSDCVHRVAYTPPLTTVSSPQVRIQRWFGRRNEPPVHPGRHRHSGCSLHGRIDLGRSGLVRSLSLHRGALFLSSFALTPPCALRTDPPPAASTRGNGRLLRSARVSSPVSSASPRRLDTSARRLRWRSGSSPPSSPTTPLGSRSCSRSTTPSTLLRSTPSEALRGSSSGSLILSPLLTDEES